MAKELNRALLEKVQYLLSNALLDKLIWAEALVYTSHLINMLPLIAIGGKITLGICSGRVG